MAEAKPETRSANTKTANIAKQHPARTPERHDRIFVGACTGGTLRHIRGVRLAHFSDTHLGYEAYRAVSATGENQRGVDIARAFVRVVDDIIDWDPALVVHSGDLAERPHISIRMMLHARKQLERLASIRPDGSRRQVVIIAGNHDLPANRREACFLELYRGIPGVHVVCDNYRVVRFEGDSIPDELSRVEAHCLPHDVLKDMAIEDRFGEVQPTPGYQSILVAHGVAGGSGLYKRVIGREFPIPTDVLVKGWAYGALGHWHRQGPVGVAGAAGRCWYAGSSENMGFGDLLDNGSERGYLRVSIESGCEPKVEPRNLPIRSMLRLGAVDGDGMTPEQVAGALAERVETARNKGILEGAVVGQNVTNVRREIWALVDVHPIRALAASRALHYEITVVPVGNKTDDGKDADNQNADGGKTHSGREVLQAVRERAQILLKDGERQGALVVAETLLARHLAHVATGEDSENARTENEPASGADGGAENLPETGVQGAGETSPVEAGKNKKRRGAGSKGK